MGRTGRVRDTYADDHPETACPSRARRIDLVHLARQTLGDKELEREILGLMMRQIGQYSTRIELATERERSSLAHALKGAALNIGAFPLATEARHVEERPGDPAAIASLGAEMEATTSFIATLLG